jgi:hypothetical protein
MKSNPSWVRSQNLQAKVRAILKFSNGEEKETFILETFELFNIPTPDDLTSFDSWFEHYNTKLAEVQTSSPENHKAELDEWLKSHEGWDLSINSVIQSYDSEWNPIFSNLVYNK